MLCIIKQYLQRSTCAFVSVPQLRPTCFRYLAMIQWPMRLRYIHRRPCTTEAPESDLLQVWIIFDWRPATGHDHLRSSLA